MEKKRAVYFLRRIYRLIANERVNIAFSELGKKVAGMAFYKANPPQTEEIQLNPDYDILAAFIHECLHIFYPKMRHKRIYALESEIRQALTLRQKKNLLKRLTEAINTRPHN